MPEEEGYPLPSGNADRDFFRTGDPTGISMPLSYKENFGELPKGVPEGSIFKTPPDTNDWGIWFSSEGEKLHAVKRPKGVVGQIEKGIHEGKGALLGVIAPVVDTITSDIPIGVMDGFMSMMEKTGMKIPEEAKNMAREGARVATTAAVTTAIFRNPAMGGASQMNAFKYAFTQVLSGFGIGAGASGATQAMFGEEGLQTDEEHRIDFMTTFGASLGGRSAQLAAKAVRSPQFLNAIKRGQQAALLDKVTPPNFRAFTRLAYWLGDVPTAWWSASGNIAGSAAGFAGASDKGFGSAEGIMSVVVPGVFNVAMARIGAGHERRLGIGGTALGPAGSWPDVAYKVTDKLDEIPKEQQIARLREYALSRGVINNSSTFRGLDTDKVSLAVLINDINKQAETIKFMDPAAAYRHASEIGKQTSLQFFPNQFQGHDLIDLIDGLNFIKGKTTRSVYKQFDPDTFKKVVEESTNPMIRDLKKALPAHQPNAINMGLYNSQPATDEAINFLGAVEKVVTDAATDVSGEKLRHFGDMVNSLRAAAQNNPDSAPMLRRISEKLKDTFVNEGIFGKAYGSRRDTMLPEEVSDINFDGQRILDYLGSSKRRLSAFMTGDEIESLTGVAKLMKAGQAAELSTGSLQRDVERITNFSKARMAFYFVSGAFLGGSGTNPMARILFGAGSVIAGGKAILMGANAVYKMGANNPKTIRKLVNAHIKGDRITEGLAWRALVRDGNPELARRLGVGEEQVQEQPGVTAGFFNRILPQGPNPFQ